MRIRSRCKRIDNDDLDPAMIHVRPRDTMVSFDAVWCTWNLTTSECIEITKKNKLIFPTVLSVLSFVFDAEEVDLETPFSSLIKRFTDFGR